MFESKVNRGRANGYVPLEANAKISSSYVQTGSFGIIPSSSYALTASYAVNSDPTFPYSGSAIITGSLSVSASEAITQEVTGLNLTSSYNLNYASYPTAIWNQQGYQFIVDYGSSRLTVTKVVDNQYVEVISGYDLSANINVGSGTWQVYGDGSYLYIISEGGFLSSWRFDTQTETLIFLSEGNKYTNYYSQIWGDGTRIYATTSDILGGNQKLCAYDVTNGILNFASETAETYYTYNSVFCQNGYIYVAGRSYGVTAYTFNGASFTKVAEILGDYGDIVSINGDGKYIYVADYTGFLSAFEHSGATISYLANIDLSSQLTYLNTIWCDDNLIWVTSGGYDQSSALLLAYSFDGSIFTQEISIDNGGDLPCYVVSDNQYYYVLRYADVYLYTRQVLSNYSIGTALSVTGSVSVSGSMTIDNQVNITGSLQVTGSIILNGQPLSGSSGSSYLKYVALLNQLDVGAPSATILENTLGSVSYAYVSPGLYHITSDSLFVREKLWYYIQPNVNGATAYRLTLTYIDSSTLLIEDANGANDGLINNSIEIRVYP